LAPHLALAVALAGWPASSAHAQSASEIAAAKEWFAEGIRLEGEGKWKDALDRFRRAQSVKHTPPIDFHVGLCEARSGDLVAALLDLDRAIKGAREKHDDKVEAAASSELADVRARTPSLEIDAPTDKAQRVLVDGAAFSTATLGSPVPMNPGDHVVVVEFASGRVEKRATLAEREAKKVAFDPPASAPAAVAAAPTPIAPPAEAPSATPSNAAPRTGAVVTTPSSSNKTLPWVLVGGGGALVAGGVVFFLLRQGEISTLDDKCPTRVHCDPSLKSEADTGSTYATLSVVLGGVGLAAVAVGAGMLVLGGSSTNDARAALVPSVLPGGGGASFVGRF
jgi:hypothetical protein